MARQTDEERKKSLKIKNKKRKGKQAYTPLSEKEVNEKMKQFIKGLKDGSIKAPLPSDLRAPHYNWRGEKVG